LYFTFFQEPRMPFEIPPIKNAIKRAYQLADGKPVEVKQDGDKRELVITRPIIDPMATVVVVEIEGDQVQK
jgi:hypothetical protein